MGSKVYLTFTRKPLLIAAKEGLPAVEVSLNSDDDGELKELLAEAIKRLGDGNDTSS